MGFFVGALLYNPKAKAILLQKRDMNAKANPGLWGFFGGSSEGDETPKQTLAREIKEELSIDIDPEKMQPLREYFNEKYQRQSYIFVIETDLEKSQMKLGEGESFDWIPLDKALSYDLTENTRKSIEILIAK